MNNYVRRCFHNYLFIYLLLTNIQLIIMCSRFLGMLHIFKHTTSKLFIIIECSSQDCCSSF